MEFREILEAVPIRKPMLCIDNIVQIKYGKSAKGYREIKSTENWLKGHFLNEPIFPGTMIIETMAQIGAFIFYDTENPKLIKSYLGKVNSIKFMNKVIPNCRMYVNAKLVMNTSKLAKIYCEASVDNKLVAQGELTLYYLEDILD